MRLLLLACATAAAAAWGKGEEPGPRSPLQVLALSSSVTPGLRLRARMSRRISLDYEMDLGLPTSIDLSSAVVGASWREPFAGGKVAVRAPAASDADPTLEWSKLWVVPGLFDAATRLQLRSTLNLRTGVADADLRLGLRRRERGPGLHLVHRIPVERSGGRCAVDVGATFTVPAEVRVSARGGLDDELRSEHLVKAELDKINLCFDVDVEDLR